MAETILIIDDDVSQLHMKQDILHHKLGYQTLLAGSGSKSVEEVLAAEKQTLADLALLDLDTLGEAGIEMIKNLKATRPNLPVLVFTSYGNDACVAKALEAGAYDFVAKPVTVERLQLTIRQMLKMRRMSAYISWLERKIAGHMDFSDMVGQSPAFKKMLATAKEAASSKTPVWIEGEEGTGKELLARAIHGGSDRAGKPFVVVNCEMLSEQRAEAVLFGQDRGFHPEHLHFVLGKLREADQGTLLLKEVGALKPEMQDHLCRMLTSGSITPVGSVTPVKVDVRVICSVNRPNAVARMVQSALVQAAQRISIAVPPLRQRREDIPHLAEHFLFMHAASENKCISGMSKRALAWLCETMWQGNITQLANLVWRAVMMCDHAELDVNNLQAAQKSTISYVADTQHNGILMPGTALLDERGQVKTLKSVEEEAIRFALQHTNGCMMRAAKSLGIGRSTLYRKVNELEASPYMERANQTTRPMMNVSSSDRS